jgi:hypothetical protein
MSFPVSRETRAFAAEIKFLVPRSTGVRIRDWVRRYLTPDPHGSGPSGDEYGITTVYLDTPEYDVFHRRRSFGRSKYRIRKYGAAGAVFLERKLRRPGMLTKRRTLVDEPLLTRLEGAEVEGWPGAWFHRRILLRHLQPVCQISYHRIARQSDSASGPIRLTLDEGLQVTRANQFAFSSGVEGLRVLDQQMILELKFRSDVPALFKRLVEEFDLRPQTASKYRIGIAAVDPLGTGSGTVSAVRQDAVDGLPCA